MMMDKLQTILSDLEKFYPHIKDVRVSGFPIFTRGEVESLQDALTGKVFLQYALVVSFRVYLPDLPKSISNDDFVSYLRSLPHVVRVEGGKPGNLVKVSLRKLYKSPNDIPKHLPKSLKNTISEIVSTLQKLGSWEVVFVRSRKEEEK